MPTEKNPFSAAGTPWLEDGRTAHWTPSRPSPVPSDLPLPCGSRRKVLSEISHITPYEVRPALISGWAVSSCPCFVADCRATSAEPPLQGCSSEVRAALQASSDSQKQCRKCVDSDAYPAEQAALLADAQTIWLQSLKCRQSALQHEMEGIVNKLHLLKSSLRDVVSPQRSLILHASLLASTGHHCQCACMHGLVHRLELYRGLRVQAWTFSALLNVS